MGRVKIKNYGSEVILEGTNAQEVSIKLKPVPAREESIEAKEVVHAKDIDQSFPDVAFVGTDAGVFVVNTLTGAQVSQLLGNKREVECFKVTKKTLYVGVSDRTTPSSERFGLWSLDISNFEAHPIEKVGDWDIVAITLNSTESLMAMTYCEKSNGNFWFQVHLYGVNPNGTKLTYHTRIGGDGWGEVKFSEDNSAVIIDGTNFPIPPQFLEETKILGKRKASEEKDSTKEKIETKLREKKRKT